MWFLKSSRFFEDVLVSAGGAATAPAGHRVNTNWQRMNAVATEFTRFFFFKDNWQNKQWIKYTENLIKMYRLLFKIVKFAFCARRLSIGMWWLGWLEQLSSTRHISLFIQPKRNLMRGCCAQADGCLCVPIFNSCRLLSVKRILTGQLLLVRS